MGEGRVAGKIALVTGGAQGIGEATAKLLGAEGAFVYVADRNAQGAQRTAQAIRDAGGQADARTVDMGDAGQIASMAASLGGRIDILVNNAAAVHLDAVDLNVVDADMEVWDEAIRVNLTGVMLACKHVIPIMLANGGGAIVMVSSMAHRFGSGNRPAYDVTKAGVNALARSVAVAFGKQGVRCNVVAPGLTLSPSVLAQIPAPMRDIYLDHTMGPSIGQPRDQAAAILFLASDESAYVNGHVLEVDGGMAAHIPVVPRLLALGQ